jgi:hypothetical protein
MDRPKAHLKIIFLLSVLSVLPAAPAAEKTNLIQQIDANTLLIGAVRLDRKERQITIPAAVNMVEGPIEYVLVSPLGKLHESIFKSVAEPLHIQTAAMLLLPKAETNGLPNVQVRVELGDGKPIPVEDVIDHTMPGKSLKPNPWSYKGSRIVDGTFLAQRDGSIIAIIADPDAIMENGRVSAEDDENWRPRKSALPPLGTPVKIVLKFPPPK